MTKDAIFVIEGTDGSGKSEHTSLVTQWLLAQGYRVAGFDFPQYSSPSAKLVEDYLAGRFGSTPESVPPYVASSFYAMDRYAAAPAMRRAISDGNIVVCNRYQASNKAHQGAKIADRAERLKFYDWLDLTEYDRLGVVRPGLTVVLHMPTAQAQLFVDQKADREHLRGRRRDLHESDLGHLVSASRCYEELCELFPDEYVMVECTSPDGELLDIATINQSVCSAIAPHLPPLPEN